MFRLVQRYMAAHARVSKPPHTLVFRKEMQSTSAPMPDGLGAVGLPEVIGLPTSVGAAEAYNTGARLEERRDLRRGGLTLMFKGEHIIPPHITATFFRKYHEKCFQGGEMFPLSG